jgi:hypothetical protein
MRAGGILFIAALLGPCLLAAGAQPPRSFVRRVVQHELQADRNDHSLWLYYEVDRKPEGTVEQWVAGTGSGTLHRILVQKGVPLAPDAQRRAIERFLHDPDLQAHQHKSDQHDDQQSEQLLRLLPDAFQWSIVSQDAATMTLHFVPDPAFSPPTWASRVFAAMAGTLKVNKPQQRIESLQGRMVKPVRFCGGLCGNIAAGGTFDVERRETAPTIWQIVETHVHVHGSVLFFKSISQDEDDVKSRFQQLPQNTTLQQAESRLLKQPVSTAAGTQNTH